MYTWTGTSTRGPLYPEIVPQKVPLEGDLYIQEPDINYGEGGRLKNGEIADQKCVVSNPPRDRVKLFLTTSLKGWILFVTFPFNMAIQI